MQPEIRIADIPFHATAPEVPRILDVYAAVRAGGGFAPLEALLAALEPWCGAHLEVLAEDADGWRYRAFGASITALTGCDMTGRPLSDLPGPAARIYHQVLGPALDGERPVLAVVRSYLAEHVHLWERLVLPARTVAGARAVVALLKPRTTRAALLGAVLEASCDGIMSLRAARDPAGRVVDAVITTANQQAADYAGHPVERLVDGRLKDLFPGLGAPAFWTRCLRVIEERATERFEINLSHRRRDTWLRITAVPLDDGFVLSFNDITDLKYALFEAECSRQELAQEMEQRRTLESELRRLSLTDDLTGVLNRRGFSGAVRAQVSAARRYGHALSVVAVDIDHFKRINDRHGHAAGDSVLMAVAAFFADATRRDLDLIGRVGGEEFMILLPYTDREGAIVLAERVRMQLADLPMVAEAGILRVTASFGVRDFEPGLDPDAFLIEADKALYAAKSAGRNRVVAYDPGLPALAPDCVGAA